MTKNKEYLENLERRNAKIRARFEKEAHDRERMEIEEFKEGYNRWRSEMSMKRLM